MLAKSSTSSLPLHVRDDAVARYGRIIAQHPELTTTAKLVARHLLWDYIDEKEYRDTGALIVNPTVPTLMSELRLSYEQINGAFRNLKRIKIMFTVERGYRCGSKRRFDRKSLDAIASTMTEAKE